MDSEHSGNTMSPFLAIVGIRNHKLLLLLVGKRSYRKALAVGISLDYDKGQVRVIGGKLLPYELNHSPTDACQSLQLPH